MAPAGAQGAPMGQPGTGWRVTGQIERVGPGINGQITEGVLVQFVTQHGINGSVFVPKLRFTPDAVRDAVNAAATQLDTVQRMTG